jgi:putative hydrolase of the HAD superfamily
MFPQAILFDLDDTIISYNHASERAWQQACRSFVANHQVPFDADTLLEAVNRQKDWYWSDPERHRTGRLNMMQARRVIVKTALAELQYHDENAAMAMADNVSKLQTELIQLFPESIHTLEKLKSAGVRMALITNGMIENQRPKIDRFDFARFFEFWLIEEEVGFGKPDLRIFQLALQKLRLGPEQVWMVGDNLSFDIEAAQKVGIYTIWNDYKKQGLPLDSPIKPDRIIGDISELLIGFSKMN